MMAIYFILLILPLPASSHTATNQIPSRQTNSPTIPAKVIEIIRASFRYMAGSKVLAQHIKAGMTEDQICATWIADLKKFNALRQKYLLYP